jgi:hypothetical protein
MKKHEFYSLAFSFVYVSVMSGYMIGKQVEFRKRQEMIKSRREMEEKFIEEKLKSL